MALTLLLLNCMLRANENSSSGQNRSKTPFVNFATANSRSSASFLRLTLAPSKDYSQPLVSFGTGTRNHAFSFRMIQEKIENGVPANWLFIEFFESPQNNRAVG